MTSGKKIDLGFGDLPASTAPKPDRAVLKQVAEEAGAAEGFTPRQSQQPAPPPVAPVRAPAPVRRPKNEQLHLKVSTEFRNEFMAAYAELAERDLSIRSAGDFVVTLFAAWKASKK